MGKTLPWQIYVYCMKTNRKLKQQGDVLDELLTTAMQFLKQQMMKFLHLPSHTIIRLITYVTGHQILNSYLCVNKCYNLIIYNVYDITLTKTNKKSWQKTLIN